MPDGAQHLLRSAGGDHDSHPTGPGSGMELGWEDLHLNALAVHLKVLIESVNR